MKVWQTSEIKSALLFINLWYENPSKWVRQIWRPRNCRQTFRHLSWINAYTSHYSWILQVFGQVERLNIGRCNQTLHQHTSCTGTNEITWIPPGAGRPVCYQLMLWIPQRCCVAHRLITNSAQMHRFLVHSHELFLKFEFSKVAIMTGGNKKKC